MLCQICKKNPATVHVQEIVNGEKRVMHFCSECAEKKAMLEPFLKGMTIAGLIQKMEEMGNMSLEEKDSGASSEQHSHEESEDAGTQVCPDCAWTVQQLKKTGRMGCPSCYRVFLPLIRKELAGIHRGLHFCGAVPAGTSGKKIRRKNCKSAAQIQEEIASLRKNLEESIRREEYELAAELRDKINALERSLPKEAGE